MIKQFFIYNLISAEEISIYNVSSVNSEENVIHAVQNISITNPTYVVGLVSGAVITAGVAAGSYYLYSNYLRHPNIPLKDEVLDSIKNKISDKKDEIFSGEMPVTIWERPKVIKFDRIWEMAGERDILSLEIRLKPSWMSKATNDFLQFLESLFQKYTEDKNMMKEVSEYLNRKVETFDMSIFKELQQKAITGKINSDHKYNWIKACEDYYSDIPFYGGKLTWWYIGEKIKENPNEIINVFKDAGIKYANDLSKHIDTVELIKSQYEFYSSAITFSTYGIIDMVAKIEKEILMIKIDIINPFDANQVTAVQEHTYNATSNGMLEQFGDVLLQHFL